MGLRNYLVRIIINYNPQRLRRLWKIKKSLASNEPFVDYMPHIRKRMIIRPSMYFISAYRDPRFFEMGTKRYIKSYLKKDMIVLDVGANIGYFTLLFSRLTGPNGKVIAFEPSDYAFDLLQKNTSINDIKNVELIKKAVSNTSGKISFNEGPEGFDVYSSTQEITHPSAQKVKFLSKNIEAITLDDFLSERGIKNVDLIKIDVEGAEYNVLKGMSNFLKSSRDMTILFEWTDMINSSVKLHDIVSLLSGLSFTCYSLDHKGNIHLINDESVQGGHMFVAKKQASSLTY